MMKKIVTSYVCPPIPDRNFDWCAYFDGEEEAGGYGYGATEAEAIQDFIDNLDDEPEALLSFASHHPIQSLSLLIAGLLPLLWVFPEMPI
jgi:hypothetical protein